MHIDDTDLTTSEVALLNAMFDPAFRSGAGRRHEVRPFMTLVHARVRGRPVRPLDRADAFRRAEAAVRTYEAACDAASVRDGAAPAGTFTARNASEWAVLLRELGTELEAFFGWPDIDSTDAPHVPEPAYDPVGEEVAAALAQASGGPARPGGELTGPSAETSSVVEAVEARPALSGARTQAPPAAEHTPEEEGVHAPPPERDEAAFPRRAEYERSAEHLRPWAALPTPTTPPPFPVSVLSPWHEKFVTSLARCTQTSEDIAALHSLGALSGAAAQTAIVQVARADCHPLPLWTLVSAPTGEGKGPVDRIVREPFEALESEWRRVDHVGAARAQSARSILLKRRAIVEREAARAEDPDERTRYAEEAAALAVELAALVDRPARSMLVEDATPAALVALLTRQPRLLLLSDEGGHLLDALRRYRTHAGALDLLLKAHSGLPLRESRVSRASSLVVQPALAIGVLPQPSLLHAVISDPQLRSRGILGRFLLAAPASHRGRRVTVHDPVDEEANAAYHAVVRRLLARNTAGVEASVLGIEGDALAAFDAFALEIDGRSGDEGDLAPIADWAQKLRGHAARLAGLLHAVEHDVPVGRSLIARATIERAIQIARYALSHASALLCPDGVLLDPLAAFVVRRLRKLARSSRVFSVRALHRSAQRVFRATSLRSVIETIERAGLVRMVPPAWTGGRTSDVYEIHPALE